MTKSFKTYLISWGVIFFLCSLIYFLVGKGTIIERFSASFWISYVFLIIAFAGQLICGYIALNKKDAKKTFYNIPLIRICYGGVIAMIVIVAICRFIPFIPTWVAILLCALVFVITLLAVLKAKLAVDVVTDVDKKVKTKTLFITLLTVDAETLMGKATTTEMKTECKKIYEKIKYSEPMSHDALASIESDISAKLQELQAFVVDNDLETVKKKGNELIQLVDERNRKCKVLK